MMDNKLTMFDYSMDYAFVEPFLDPKSRPGYLTHEQAIEFYGTLGVDGVELMDGYWHNKPVSHIKKVCNDAGLPIISYCFYEDLIFPEEKQRREAVEKVFWRIDRAAELGAKFCMFWPGGAKEGVSLDEMRQLAIRGLRECADHAKSAGVTLVMENIDYAPWRPLHGTATQCVELCKAVDSPAFRLVYDCGATLYTGDDPLGALRIMAPYVVHVHIKNSRDLMPDEVYERYRDAADGRLLTGTVLDAGIAKIPMIVEELKRINYQGYILVEFQGEDDPRPALKYDLDYIRRQMQR